jgi:nitrate reductase NapAB chaperone NapD
MVRVQQRSRARIDELGQRLRRLPGVEVAAVSDEGLALVVESETVGQQRALHEQIAGWPEVEQVLVAFQSREV